MSNDKPFAIWHVSDDEEYRLVLTTTATCELEEKLCRGQSLFSIIGSRETGLPSLKTMLTVIHAATQRFNHGVKFSDVCAAFDRYVDNGGSQIDFYTDVYLAVFEASGFFQREQAEAMAERRETVK